MKKIKSYKGINLYPMNNNVLGSYWEALTPLGFVRADSLEGIKDMIDQRLSEIITEKRA